MNNFTNYSRLQLIVERQDYGTDGTFGGNYNINVAFSGSPLDSELISILGYDVSVNVGDTPATVALAFDSAVSALGSPGLSSTTVGSITTISYDTNIYVGPLPDVATGEIESTNGVTATFEIKDARDRVLLMKHSEYEDSDAGLNLATIAMYELVATSSTKDKVQMQRIMLSDTDTELITTNLTAQVIGKDYQNYSV